MSDLIEPTRTKPHAGGTQRLYRFENGYGASVVRFTFGGIGGSYGAEAGLWELAVLKYEGEKFELVYDTPIADDVIGWCNEEEIQGHLRRIRDLPAAAVTS
jgi:hypothetical protein